MVTTTSAALTISSVHSFGDSLEISIPTSVIACTATGFNSVAGSDPPDQATARSPASCRKKPSAI
jgi:hypothetical protein